MKAGSALPSLNKVLYVEDEVDIHLIAKIALEDLGGLTLKCCFTGKEAIEQAPVFQPDLFLLDVMLPEIDGPTILKALRQINSLKNVPAIFLTARVQDKEIEQYEALGIIGVIKKPFDPMILADSIRTYWSKYHEKKQSK